MTCFARCIRLGPTVLVCSALIASTACVPSGRSIGGDPFQGSSAGSRSGSRSGELRIQVRNSNFNEGTVYAVRAGSLRRRLGRVEGVSDGDFRMPLGNSDQIHFEIDLLASRNCVTRTVFVEPGETVLIVIDSSARPRSNGVNSMCDVQRSR